MNKPIFSLILMALFSGSSCYALTPQEIVKKGDDVLNSPKDAFVLNTMEIIEKNGSLSIRESEMYQKGTEMRLIRFLAPADQRGIAFLSLPNDTMYLYLPAFHKIRQIASHIKNQNFAGTDFTYDDLSSFELAETHDSALIREEQEHYVLKLTPLDRRGKDYEYLYVFYQKDTFYPVKIEYYDRSQTVFKVLERKDIKKIKGHWISMALEVRNMKNEHATISRV